MEARSMNSQFAEATTGVAFVLTLSKRQCNTLLRLRAHEGEFGKGPIGGRSLEDAGWKDGPAAISIVQGDSLRALRDRGLVFWHTDHKGQANGFGGLTKAGELAASLLDEAGLSINATNTLSVLKRLERAA
jgi:hypothetical protein